MAFQTQRKKESGRGSVMRLVMSVLSTTSWKKYRKSGLILELRPESALEHKSRATAAGGGEPL